MKRIKRCALWLATISGIAFVALVCLAFVIFKRQQERNLHLAQAVTQQNEAQVRALLAEGADPNAPNNSSSLTWIEAIKKVCHVGPSKDRGYTILMSAASHPNEEILRRLLDSHGDVHAHDDYEITALVEAVSNRRHRNVQLLVQYGADVNCSGLRSTPLIMAVLGPPDTEDILFLLAHGADPNSHDKYGNTPLIEAAGNPLHFTGGGSPEAIRVLLRAGADVNTRGYLGTTALMNAAEYGQPKCAAMLLEAGADPTPRLQNGANAEYIATDNHHPEIARLIHNYRPPSVGH